MNCLPNTRAILASTVAITVLTSAIASASDWPCWRGADRDGVSRETGWSSTGQADDVWRRDVGLGYSCTIVRDGRVYAVGFALEAGQEDKRDGRGVDTVFCLDAETGEEIWSIGYPSLILDYEHGGGTLTTPTLDGEDLFILNRTGMLRCLDPSNGASRWELDLTEAVEADFGRYGFGSSPVVIDDRVFVNVGKTVALDRSDGTIIWSTDDLGAGFSTACPFTLDDEACLAIFGATGLTILRQDDGEQLHQTPWKRQMRNVEAATPIAVGESIFLSSGYQQGCGLYAFGDDGVTEVFRTRAMRNKMSGCVFWDGHFYGFDESMLKCVDLEGKEQWRQRGLGNGALMVSDGRLILTTSKGELIVAAASPDGFNEDSRVRLFEEGVFWSTPVLADGRIYVRGSLGDLVCRDHRAAAPVATAVAPSVDASDVELPSAATLIARHLEQSGGLAALDGHTSLTMHCNFEMRAVGILPTVGKIKYHAPNAWSSQFTLSKELGGAEVGRFFDGTTAWEVSFEPGLIEDERAVDLKDSTNWPYGVLLLGQFDDPETVGLTTFDDRACFEVRGRTASGQTRSLYFDQATGFLAGKAGTAQEIVILRDYRQFGDLHMASVRKTFESGTGIEQTWTIQNITFDDVDPQGMAVPAYLQKSESDA